MDATISPLTGSSRGCPLANTSRRYRSAEEHIQGFKKVFDLRSFVFERRVSEEKMFGKKINPYFVIACVYNHKNQILSIHDTKDEAWSVPGNYLACGENLLQCLNRVVADRTGMFVDVARAFCEIENTFVSNSERIVQRGIGFLVQARPQNGYYRDLEKRFVDDGRAWKNAWYMGSAEIIEIARDVLLHDPEPFQTALDEVDCSQSEGWKYQLHSQLVSPLLRPFASATISAQIGRIMSTFPPFGSILDAACGTDHMIIQLSDKYPGADIYANDLCWNYLQQLAKHDSSRRIIFLNQSVTNFWFRESAQFDVVLFKNTLHHLKSPREAEVAIRQLCAIGKRVIIVDIENPGASNKRASVCHCYYKYWLKDCGGLFFSWDAFRNLIQKVALGRRIEFSCLSTLKGRYMFAVIHPTKS